MPPFVVTACRGTQMEARDRVLCWIMLVAGMPAAIVAGKGHTTPISKFGTGIECLETRLENSWTRGDEPREFLEPGDFLDFLEIA